MKLWRAYETNSSYDWTHTTVIGVFLDKSDANAAVLKWYESLESKIRRGCESGKIYDILEDVVVEEFETGELWPL